MLILSDLQLKSTDAFLPIGFQMKSKLNRIRNACQWRRLEVRKKFYHLEAIPNIIIKKNKQISQTIFTPNSCINSLHSQKSLVSEAQDMNFWGTQVLPFHVKDISLSRQELGLHACHLLLITRSPPPACWWLWIPVSWSAHCDPRLCAEIPWWVKQQFFAPQIFMAKLSCTELQISHFTYNWFHRVKTL